MTRIIFCCLLLTYASAGLTEDLQRLFTTPDQRLKLNRAREHPRRTTTSSKESSVSPSRQITFNGLVVRSQGPTTAWFNGSVGPFEGFTVNLENRKGIEVPVTIKKTVRLKPGETVNTLDGDIRQNYEPAASDETTVE